MRLYWHPIAADLIVSATFEFISGNVLEERKDVMEMELQPRRGDGPGWPEYLRRMTSLATPFSVFVFTRKEFGDEELARWVQGLPEIDNCVAYINDILS
jgi:hypothetical protein